MQCLNPNQLGEVMSTARHFLLPKPDTAMHRIGEMSDGLSVMFSLI